MLECKDISFYRDDIRIISGINFVAQRKSIVLIIGKNGSGKTTLLRVISGLLNPTTGCVLVNGYDIHDNQNTLDDLLYMGHKNANKKELTVYENLEFWSKMASSFELLDAAIVYFQLNRVLDSNYGSLSAGWQRRVTLARLLLSNAKLWLIDEPFANLDNDAIELTVGLVDARVESGGAVLLTAHDDKIAERFSSECVLVKL